MVHTAYLFGEAAIRSVLFLSQMELFWNVVHTIFCMIFPMPTLFKRLRLRTNHTNPNSHGLERSPTPNISP